MPNIAIIVGSIGRQNGLLHLSGVYLVDPGVDDFPWEVAVPYTDNANVTNTAIQNAAVAAALLRGLVVLPSDQKLVFGGAA